MKNARNTSVGNCPTDSRVKMISQQAFSCCQQDATPNKAYLWSNRVITAPQEHTVAGKRQLTAHIVHERHRQTALSIEP
ncbi:hypothetical protein CPC08DRAFT_712031 [Agrocybe pediades]|nr:hypothetical protein CPC08DRAFT_712031 [Agrocybe pediades]